MDITEEIVRMGSHLQQFKASLEMDGNIGRKLDFIVQEMNRETNTMASKANNAEIANLVVEIKGELEKIREQIQNIEQVKIGKEVMQARLVNIGYGTIIAVDRIIAVVAPESAPIKRIVQEAKELKNLIDATYGRRTRSVIIMDNSTVVLSAVQPETITNRVNMDIIKEKGRVNEE